MAHRCFGKKAEEIGGRVAKVFVEFQRKSFHMIGGPAPPQSQPRLGGRRGPTRVAPNLAGGPNLAEIRPNSPDDIGQNMFQSGACLAEVDFGPRWSTSRQI